MNIIEFELGDIVTIENLDDNDLDANGRDGLVGYIVDGDDGEEMYKVKLTNAIGWSTRWFGSEQLRMFELESGYLIKIVDTFDTKNTGYYLIVDDSDGLELMGKNLKSFLPCDNISPIFNIEIVEIYNWRCKGDDLFDTAKRELLFRKPLRLSMEDIENHFGHEVTIINYKKGI